MNHVRHSIRVGLAVAYFIAAGSSALAQSLTVQPAVVSMDDPIVIDVIVTPGSQAPQSVDTDNVALEAAPRSVSLGQYRFIGKALHPGPASVGPVRAADGTILVGERRGLQVSSTPVIVPDNPVQTLDALAREGLVPVYIHRTIRPERAVVGQQVFVSWTASCRNSQHELITAGRMPPLASLDGAGVTNTMPPISQVSTAEHDGITDVLVGSATIVPKKAGILHIPQRVLSIDVTRVNETSAGVGNTYLDTVRRYAPGIDIPVLDRDPSIDAVATSASLTGTVTGSEAHLTLTGRGELRDIPAPRLSSTQAGILTDTTDLGTHYDQATLAAVHEWTFRFMTTAESTTVRAPFSLRVLDPDSGEIRELNWAGDVLVGAPPTAPAHVPEPPRPSLLSDISAFANRWSWAIIVVVVGTLLVLARRARG